MTSRHCFFRVMKEDFRHRIWMLALSILGNMLTIPVVYLMSVGEYHHRYLDEPAREYAYGILGLSTYFSEILLWLAGIIAICGALIVGFAGFRYLFHKNMVDTYHSIPVKRSTLFAATWLNGFLIWFVPFLIMFLLTLVLGEIRLSSLRENLFSQPQLAIAALENRGDLYFAEQMTEGRLLLTALQTAGILIIVFLLVYNLCLVAVMLCGNALNTLTLAAFLGVGAIALYGLGMIFCAIYLDTFLGESTAYRQVVYASPLVSSIYLLFLGGVNVFGEGEGVLLLPALINLAIAVGMGVAAFFLYLRRPSELAEQGVKLKPVKFVVQVTIALAGVMSGWLIFCAMTDSLRGTRETAAWGIFGALLVGILAFGVMDIIMNMDFKAFYRHKILMAATMAAGLLLCFAFRQDWFGYDSYLPREQQIAEIAIWMPDASNKSDSYDVTAKDHPLQSVHIRDSAVAHAFLEEAVRTVDDRNAAVYEEDVKRMETMNTFRIQQVYVKVTLKSGRKYYRRYHVTSWDCDAAYALVETKEYRDANYAVSPEEIAQPGQIRLRHMGYTRSLPVESARRFAEDVCTAYNRDLEENPGTVIRGDGRLFSVIQVGNRNLEVFEGMSHTRAVLREYGYENYADSLDVKDVTEIRLQLDYNYKGADLSEIDLVEDARRTYRVFNDSGEAVQGGEPKTESAVYEIPDEDTGYEIPDQDMVMDQLVDKDGRIALSITDPGEIRELLGLISYEYRRRNSLFSVGEMTDAVQLVTADNTYTVRLYLGELPEKYILRFGELQKALMQEKQ